MTRTLITASVMREWRRHNLFLYDKNYYWYVRTCSPPDLSITMALTVVIDLEVGALIVTLSKSINGWVSTGGVPGVGLDMWVIVTILISLWRVVTEVDWVLTELDSG